MIQVTDMFPEKTPQKPNSRINVLLVDDSAFARSVARRVLRSTGIKSILEAGSGKEAIEILDRVGPLGRLGDAIDVIFCDLMMPDMDGVEIVRHVAAFEAPPAIVLLSGADEALLNTVENTARARGLYVLGALQKPLTPDAVSRVLVHLRDKPMQDGVRTTIDISSAEVEAALAKDEILLHFQPKISLADGSVAGFEALARWQHPSKGMIPPGIFIAVAEESGQIGTLTDRTTTLAFNQCARWSTAGLRTKVSVNLSAYMLVDLDLPDRMEREAARCRIDPNQIILEITESGLFRDIANTLDILARLHMKGFPLSIDDFGTGYSSMEQLRRVPFAEMKIDRAFVNGAAENAKARAILETSALLGKSLGVNVVAEGVETQEDWNTVRTAGVDLVQGYYVAKPMPAGDVLKWLADWARRRTTAAYA